MASDDFITLESSSDSEHQEEETSLHESKSVPSEAECGTSTDLKGDPDGDNLEAIEENDEIKEGEHVQDMDLESDSSPEQPFIKDDPKLLEDTPGEIEPEKSPDNVCAHTINDVTATNLLIDDSRILLLVRFIVLVTLILALKVCKIYIHTFLCQFQFITFLRVKSCTSHVISNYNYFQ